MTTGPTAQRISDWLQAAPAARPRTFAFGLYLALSALIFGRAAAPHLSTIYLGEGIDQCFFVWCLVWWPHALAHHLNPFITRLIFAPEGFNLTWSTSIPLLSLLAFPLTATAGPIATFNLLCVLFPALSGWAAFALCYRLTPRLWPALLGGYIYGFSPFMLAQMFGGHLNLLAAFPLPLAVLLAIARLDGTVGRRSFGIAMLALLSAQFLITTEIVATMAIVGALAITAAWAMGDGDLRRRLVGLAATVFLAACATALIVSPYLYYLFTGFRAVPIYSPSRNSIDLLNFLVPTSTDALGAAIAPFLRTSSTFTGNLSEQGGYIGVPLLAIALWFLWRSRRRFEGRMLGLMLIAVAVGAMGPRLHVAGQSYFKLPWSLLHRTPLIDQALPARLAVYLFLLLAIVAARCLGAQGQDRRLRAIAGVLVFVSLFPNPSARIWATPGAVAPPPALFTTGAYRRYLSPGEIVAPLPYAHSGSDACMMWQALTGMYFRLAGGYPALSPLSFLRWPIVRAANERATIPDAVEQWKAFAANHDVTAVLVGDQPTRPDVPSIEPILAALGPPASADGGVRLYRVAPAQIAAYRGLNWVQMETLEDGRRFETLLMAAQRFLASGAEPASLSPVRAAQMGLLPMTWINRSFRGHDYRVDMYSAPGGAIAIRLMGTREALQPIIDRYKSCARRVVFLADRRHVAASHLPPGTYYYPVIITFDRAGLDRAVNLAAANPIRLDLRPRPSAAPR